MTTNNNELSNVSVDDNEVGTDKDTSTTQELNPGFSGETITLAEAVNISEKSKVTVLKVIKDKKLQTVGLVKSQKRGRPANLYDRAELLAALHTA